MKEINAYLMDADTPLKQRKEWYAAEVIEGEIWKDVEGSALCFRISNHGRIKRKRKTKETFIMPYMFKGRFQDVKLDFRGKLSSYRVSHLVAHHFIRERKPNEVVFHKNGIIWENHSANLEYVTRQESGRRSGSKTKKLKSIVLLNDAGEVEEEYRSAREAANHLYTNRQSVLDNCHGRTKSANGYQFRFAADFYGEDE